MQKYIGDRLRAVMKLDDPPQKLAFAFALGVFIAFSPWFGLHILSCILFAWLFRVSKLVVLTASFINNPWTVVPLYGFCIWLGMKITGSGVDVPRIAWEELSLSNVYGAVKPYLWSFVAGTLTAGVVFAFLSYFLFYWSILRYRRQGEPSGGEWKN